MTSLKPTLYFIGRTIAATILCTLPACAQAVKAPANLTQEGYYKMMYDQAAAATVAATNVTYWTISIVGAVFGVIVVLQLLFSYRINNDKLQEISRTLAADATTREASLERSLIAIVSRANEADRSVAENRTQFLESQLRTSITSEINKVVEATGQRIIILERELKNTQNELFLFQSKQQLKEANFGSSFAEYKIAEFINRLNYVSNKEELDVTLFQNINDFLQYADSIEHSFFLRLQELFSYYIELDLPVMPRAIIAGSWLSNLGKIKVFKYPPPTEENSTVEYVENNSKNLFQNKVSALWKRQNA